MKTFIVSLLGGSSVEFEADYFSQDGMTTFYRRGPERVAYTYKFGPFWNRSERKVMTRDSEIVMAFNPRCVEVIEVAVEGEKA